MALIKDQLTCSIVFDNWQRSITKLWQTDGKSSIFHRVTAYLIKQDKAFVLPLNSVMESPSGIKFKVTKVEAIDIYVMRIFGALLDDRVDIDPADNDGNRKRAEIEVNNSVEFLWPTAGWDVVNVPGFKACQEIKYVDQYIPAPFRARVKSEATCDDLLFRKREFAEMDDNDARVLTTDKYHSTILRARSFIDLQTFSRYMEEERIREE